MTTWFTSDLHLGHQNILAYARRPFVDLDEMHAEITRRWNERVEPDDVVWILGDLAMGRIDETLPICAGLTGIKVLICGNHDRPWAGNTRDRRHDWAYRYRTEAGLAVVLPGQLNNQRAMPYVLRSANGNYDRSVYLSHFPYIGDSHDVDRYEKWRPHDDGRSWLLHGHVHEAWKVDATRRQINVGVDVWDFAPVAQTELSALIDNAEASVLTG